MGMAGKVNPFRGLYFFIKAIYRNDLKMVTCYPLLDFVLFDLILYVPSTISQLNRDGSSWVEPVLS